MSYLLVFLMAFTLTALTTPLSMRLGHRLHLVDHPGGRRKHHGIISRIGGVAITTGFIGTGGLIFLFSEWGLFPPISPNDYHLLQGVILGTSVMFIVGLWDDWQDLPARWQFASQFLVALIAIYFEVIFEQVTLPIQGQTNFPWWLYYPLTIFWIMGMINTINWLDGLDGLATGVTAIASLLFALHAYSLGQTIVAMFPLALMAACLGFLPYNFHPARIFMGSSGSMVLGFALATLSILAPAKVATALLVLGLPILDVVWLVLQRWRQQGSPNKAGRDHLHFRLFDLGLSQRQVVLLYYSFCALFGLQALLITDRLLKLAALLLMSSLTLGLLWWLGSKRNEE